jgi:ribosomal protein L37AE/L43A
MDYYVISKIISIENQLKYPNQAELIEKKNKCISKIAELKDMTITSTIDLLKTRTYIYDLYNMISDIDKKLSETSIGYNSLINEFELDICDNLYDFNDADSYIIKNKMTKKIIYKIDPAHMRKIKKTYDIKCEMCGSQDLYKYNSGTYTCRMCNHSMDFCVADKRSTTIKDEDAPTQNNVYFSRQIARIQNKNKIFVDNDVIDKIKKHLSVSGIHKYDKITTQDITRILKELKLSQYYADSEAIALALNPKLKILELHFEDNELIQKMYTEVAKAWDIVKPQEKKSSLNIPYVMRKILELIGNNNDYLDTIKLPQSWKKYEEYWYKICVLNGYTYIPTYNI